MKRKPPGELKIVFCESEGGYNPKRLSMALRMLVSEKDVIEFITHKQSPELSRKIRKPDQEESD